MKAKISIELAPITSDWPVHERLRLIVRVWLHDARKWYRKIKRRRRLRHWRPIQVVTQTIIQQPQYIMAQRVGRLDGIGMIPDGGYEPSGESIAQSKRRAEAYWAKVEGSLS